MFVFKFLFLPKWSGFGRTSSRFGALKKCEKHNFSYSPVNPPVIFFGLCTTFLEPRHNFKNTTQKVLHCSKKCSKIKQIYTDLFYLTENTIILYRF